MLSGAIWFDASDRVERDVFESSGLAATADVQLHWSECQARDPYPSQPGIAILACGRSVEPIYRSPDGRWLAAMKGSMYRRDGLRHRAEGAGCRLETDSPLEWITQLFARYSDTAWSHLDGTFSLLVADLTRQQVSFVSDRFGSVPMFLRREGQRLWFSNSCKWVAEQSKVPHWDAANTDAYLAFGFVPSGARCGEIQQLTAGQSVSISAMADPQLKLVSATSDDLLSAKCATELVRAMCGRLTETPGQKALLVTGASLGQSVVEQCLQETNQDYVRVVTGRNVGSPVNQVSLVPDRLTPETFQRFCRSLVTPVADVSAIWSYLAAQWCQENERVLVTSTGQEMVDGLVRNWRPRRFVPQLGPGSISLCETLSLRMGSRMDCSPFMERIGRLCEELAQPAARRWFARWTKLSDSQRATLMRDDALRQICTDPVRYLRPFPSASRRPNGLDESSWYWQTWFEEILPTSQLQPLAAFANDFEIAYSVPWLSEKFEFISLADNWRTLRTWFRRWLRINHNKNFQTLDPASAWLNTDLREFAQDVLTQNGSQVATWLDLSELRSRLKRVEPWSPTLSKRIWMFLVLEVWLRASG